MMFMIKTLKRLSERHPIISSLIVGVVVTAITSKCLLIFNPYSLADNKYYNSITRSSPILAYGSGDARVGDAA